MIAGYDRADAKAAADAFADPDSAPEAPIVYPEMSSDAGWLRSKGKGKGKGSRWNAVRHGCMAQTLIPADLQIEVDQCTAMLTEEYRPTTAFEVSAIARMGRLRAQLERLDKMIVIDLQRTMDRARLVWHEDRDVYIDQLVERLAVDSGVGAGANAKQAGRGLVAEDVEVPGRGRGLYRRVDPGPISARAGHAIHPTGVTGRVLQDVGRRPRGRVHRDHDQRDR